MATSGGYDYWYRDVWQRGHPSLRSSAVMVGYLLAKGAKYPISTAAVIGDRERVEAILAKEPEQAVRLDSARISPLTYAAGQGHTEIVRLLLKHGASPNIPEEGAPNGLALFRACQGNHLDTAKVLLEYGADPNAGADSSGCCLTICKLYHGTRAKPLQRLLREHGAYTPPYDMGTNQLKQAIRDNHPATRHEEFLGNVMSKCDEHLLDLYLAFDPSIPKRMEHCGGMALPGSTKLVRKLLNNGLDVHRRDWVGRTLLHGCAERFDRTIAAVLLDAGADINAKDVEFQETPIAAAIRVDPCCRKEGQPKVDEKRKQMVRFLLTRGAATNLPDDEPWATPLAQARQRGLAEIEEMLVQHGAER